MLRPTTPGDLQENEVRSYETETAEFGPLFRPDETSLLHYMQTGGTYSIPRDDGLTGEEWYPEAGP